MAHYGENAIGKDEVGGSNPPSSSKKHRKLSFSVFFCCKNIERSVGQNVGQPPDPHRDPHGEMRGKVERGADGKAVILKGLFFVSPRSCILRQDMLHYLPLILSASYEDVRGIYEAVTMV